MLSAADKEDDSDYDSDSDEADETTAGSPLTSLSTVAHGGGGSAAAGTRPTLMEDASTWSVKASKMLGVDALAAAEDGAAVASGSRVISSKAQKMLGVTESGDHVQEKPAPRHKEKKESTKIALDLEQITFLFGTKFKSLAPKHLAGAAANEMQSITETKGENWLKKQSAWWVQYNCHQLSRNYPKGHLATAAREVGRERERGGRKPS